MKNNREIPIHFFTKKLLEVGVIITEIETREFKQKAQILLKCANNKGVFTFNWNNSKKCWLLA